MFFDRGIPDVTQDDERKQSVDEAERTYRAMVRSYTEYGYDLIELPCASVEARLQFISRVGAEWAREQPGRHT